MHIILKCVADHEVPYTDCLQYLTCQANDIVICDSYIDIKGDFFGFGKNYKTDHYGLFPIRKFVIIDSTNYVNKQLLRVIFRNQSSLSIEEKKSTPGIFHRVTKKSVGKASICIICGEFLMGLRLEFIHCTVCNQLFHNICYENHKSTLICRRVLKTTNKNCVSSLVKMEMSITDWSNEQILQWLCSSHFFRLVDLFESKKVTGKDILECMAKDENEIVNCNNTNNFKFWCSIEDSFHRECLYSALATLLGLVNTSNNESHTGDNVVTSFFKLGLHEDGDIDSSEEYFIEIGKHKFRDTSYTSKMFCSYCDQMLLGLTNQGLHCVKCRKDFHKICAFQSNILFCSETSELNDVNIFDSSIFGVTLSRQTTASNGVPLFIKCCIEELERRFNYTNSGSELLKLYSVPSVTKDTIELKRLFSHPTFDKRSNLIGITDISDILLAKLIKLYFKELPEPLLTYELYHSLMECLKIDNDDKATCFNIHAILSYFPMHNRQTLQFLIRHFEFICSNISDNPNKIKNIAKQWSCIFSKSLLWPPQIMITEFPKLKSRHQRIIQILFEYKLALTDKFTLSTSHGAVVDEKLTLSQSLDRNQLYNLQSNMDEIDSDINSQDWYWSDTTKEEVNEFMTGLQDGYFMVRDSSDKSQGGMYTLTIRKDGENKLIRILCRNDRYGFQEPCPFTSVAQLIRYYQSHRLSEYNDQLNLTLRYACSKRKSELKGQSNDFYRMENEELIDSLYRTMKDYAEINMRVDRDTETYENIQKELDEVTKCLKGIDRIQNWCTNHSVHIMNKIQSSQITRDPLQKCLLQLNKKLNDCGQVIKEMNERRDILSLNSTTLLSSLSNDRPVIKKLNRRQSSCIRTLKDRGVPDELFSSDAVDYIDKLCSDIRTALNKNNPINNISNWFIADITREEADMKLSGKQHGTFLIRQSREPNKFALDIVVDRTVQHCRILCINGRYGFIENDCLYQSLEDLVKTFHLRSLAQYNTKLDTKLAFPIKYS